MNQVLEQLKNRASVRTFTGEKIKDEDIQTIVETAQRAANSINGQQISLIVVRDKERLSKIAELSGGQQHIAEADTFILVVADFHRANYALGTIGKENLVTKTIEGVLTGAVDAGIMLTTIQTAAESLGYGTTAIGGIRRTLDKTIEMFDLPKGVVPIIGTTIGVPASYRNKTLKPRVPLDSFVFFEKYDKEKVEKGVEIHEKEMQQWIKDEGLEGRVLSYKDMLARIYGQPMFEEENDIIKRQGLEFDGAGK